MIATSLTRTMLLALVTAAAVGGCTPSAQPEAQTPTGPTSSQNPTTVTVTVTPDITPGTASPDGADPDGTTDPRVTGPPQALYGAFGWMEPWVSPSGNIICRGHLLDEGDDEEPLPPGEEVPLIGCSVEGAQWSFSEPTSDGHDCPVDWVDNELWLGGGAAGGDCRGDAVFDGERWTLEYGQEVRVGSAVCHSLRTGMLCVDLRTGSGFRAARDSYNLFNVEDDG